MKRVLSIVLIGFTTLSFAHRGYHFGANCTESIDCIESLSNCFPIKDRVFTVIYLVRKKVTCLNHNGETDTINSTQKESFETGLSRNTCELYKANISQAYGLCE